jgi:flavorubredoxin
MSETKINEVVAGIHRISTCVPDVAPGGFTFNQFLLAGEEPMLFHTGPRGMFPLVSEAIATLMPVDRLAWLSFGHVESDECGAMNSFLKAAPSAQVAHGEIGCMVSLNDLADRPPRVLADGEVLDLGGFRMRCIYTPHVPHGWESILFFEEVTRTLFCGDLFTQPGDGPALTTDPIVDAAVEAEAMFRASSLAPTTGATLRKLADLDPAFLALMHGSTFQGDCAGELRGLAQAYEERFMSSGGSSCPSPAST